METEQSESSTNCQCAVDNEAHEVLSSEQEKTDESQADSSTAQSKLQGHEVMPDPGVTGIIPHMETGVSVSGTVETDSMSHEVVSQTAEVTLNPSEAMEMCMSEQDRDQHPSEKDSTGPEVVPESGTAGIIPNGNEAMEMSVSEPNAAHTDTENKTVEEDMASRLLGGGGSLALLSKQYRGESSDDLSESESDSSSTSSSSSSSSPNPVIPVKEFEQDEEEVGAAPGKKKAPVRTQDELLFQDLPAVENLNISLPAETYMEPVGIISSIVDQLVIIESKRDTPPLNEDSVLFSKDRVSVGRVFEVFGPVCQPYYILRFNSKEDIEQKDLKIREPVYFAPKIKDLTEYIFVEQIKQTKGSDASWKNDHEPPQEALEFSDDEAEKRAKQKLKAQRRPPQQQQEESDSADSESSASRPPPPQRRKPRQNKNSPRGQPAHHKRHGGFHANYHTNPYFQQDLILHPTDPYRPPFQGRGYPPPYPRAPPPHVGIDPWHPWPYPGPMFYPPPPPPPPPST